MKNDDEVINVQLITSGNKRYDYIHTETRNNVLKKEHGIEKCRCCMCFIFSWKMFNRTRETKIKLVDRNL